MNILNRSFAAAFFIITLWLSPHVARAYQMPTFPAEPTNVPLDSWSFEDSTSTNWTSDYGYAPVSFTNLNFSYLGDGASLVVDTNVPAWLQYNVFENDGATNLTVNSGTVLFWFAPDWESADDTNGGAGPGEYGRLFEAGGYTTNSSYGWWSIYVDPLGENIYFGSQTNNGLGNTYALWTPIDWTTNYFHFIALTYSQTNVSLYLDGVLATNDPGGLNIWPGLNVLSNGFWMGSDSNGIYQAHGMFNSVATFNYPLDSNDVVNIYNWLEFDYVMNPYNLPYEPAINSAPTQTTQYTPFNDVITGPGDLIPIGSAASCRDGTNSYNVWLTNIVASLAGNGSMTVQFTIEGGSNGVPFDVFANSVLSFGPNGVPWGWMGQGYQCNTYMLTNMPTGDFFLILGTPQDSDHDGLTDAYELLVSKSSPTNYTTDGTGMADGWEVLYFGHTGINPNADADGDGLSNYQEFLMYSAGYNPAEFSSYTNGIGDGYEDFSGDGLANLMEASFGGNMMTNNPAWKLDTDGDGMPDLYKVMVGVSTNSAPPPPNLPSYSQNPIQ